MERRLKDESKAIIRSGGHRLLPTFSRYENAGGLFIGYVSAKEGPYADLTVNIPGMRLAEDEIIVNVDFYDKAMLRAAEKAGLFTHTGQKVP